MSFFYETYFCDFIEAFLKSIVLAKHIGNDGLQIG